MAVNYDIWGAPETWVNGANNENQADIKYPESTKNTYRKQYNAGGIPWNTIDLSPAFWGIGKKSILCQPHYLSAHTPNGELDNIDITSERVFEPVDKPLIFLQSYQTSFNPTYCYNYRYRYIDGEHQTTSYPVGRMYTDKVMMSFNYQKIMAFGYVKMTSDLAGTLNIADLQTFIDNYDTYIGQFITGFTYGVRFGDGETARPAASSGCFLPFIPFEVNGKSISYNNISFYATAEGMSIAPMSTSSGNSITPLGNGYINDASGNATVGDSTTGFAYRYCKGSSVNVPLYYYDDTSSLWTIAKTTRVVSSSQTNWLYSPVIEITAENKDNIINYVLSQIAYIGLPFTTSANNAARAKIGDTGVYLPKFDCNGVTTGEYEEGQNALTLPNSQWTDGRESGYDPNRTPDGDTGNLNNFPTYQNRYANSNAVYALDESNFIKFVSDINNLYLNDADDTQMKLDFKGSNPCDYIIGVYGIPFLCNYVVPSGSDESFNLGPVPLPTAQGKKVDTTLSLMRDCGTVTIPAKGNFLDYEPYTQIELYIPMCGTIQLDCAQVVGRTLHVIVYYDVTTMACTGCVYRDAAGGETLIHTINGTIGASLPLTSARMGDYQNSVQTTKNALKQNEMRTALGIGGAVIGIAGAALAPETGGLSLALAGAAIGGLTTAAGGAMTEKQLQYDLTHKQPALSQCSAADGMTAQLVSDLRPWIFIKRAEKLISYDAETYGKTVGFACCINSTVGAFSGYTVYSNVDLSGIPATKTEIDMIRAKLNSGIYI